MQKRNSLAIGLFVLGAVALAILAIVLFGAGNLLPPTAIYTMSFDKSVNGLVKGAPVMFRGIRIGEVTDIKLSFDETHAAHAPDADAPVSAWPISVTVKLYPNSVAFAENRNVSWLDKLTGPVLLYQNRSALEIWLEEMILKRGLRAQLQTQNFLTGLLYIELDLFREETATDHIRDLVAAHVIPTRISAFERLYLSLNQNDFSGQINQLYTVVNVIGKFFSEGKAENMLNHLGAVAANLDSTLQNVNALCARFNSPQGDEFLANSAELVAALSRAARNLEAVLARLNGKKTDDILDQSHKALKSLNGILADIRAHIAPNKPLGRLLPIAAASAAQLLASAAKAVENLNQATPQLQPASDDARQRIRHTDAAVTSIAQPLPQLIAQLNGSLQSLDRAAQASARLLDSAQANLAGPDATVVRELSRTIDEARQAAQAIRALAELLQQQPEALLRGKR